MRKILLNLFQFLIPDPKAIKTFILKVIIVAIAILIFIEYLKMDNFQLCGQKETFIECWKVTSFTRW